MLASTDAYQSDGVVAPDGHKLQLLALRKQLPAGSTRLQSRRDLPDVPAVTCIKNDHS